MFDVRPMDPLVTENEKPRDLELRNTISTAITICGFYGEDAAIKETEVLKQIGRYDLLSPCVKCKGDDK